MAIGQGREHGDTAAQGPNRFGLLELTSADAEFLALNLPLAKKIAAPFVDRFYDKLVSNSDFGALALKSGDLKKSKTEYKSYFIGLFGGATFEHSTNSSEFVHGLDTRYYLTALPLALDLFAELALKHPDRSLVHPTLGEGHMPDLIKAVSIKLWADGLWAVDNFATHQEEVVTAVVTESNRWRNQATIESRLMLRISEVIQMSREIDQAATEKIAEAIGELIQFDRFSISRYDPKTNIHTIGPSVGIEPYSTGHRMTVDPKQIARDFTETNVKVFDEAGIDELITRSPSIAAVKDSGIKTLMGVALRWQGDLLGFMSIQSTSPGAYDENTEAIANRLASSIATALMATDRIEYLEQQTAVNLSVNNLVQALLSESTAESGMKEFTRSLADVFDSDMAAVNVFTEESRIPLLSVAYDRQSEEFDNLVASHAIPDFIFEDFISPVAKLSGRDEIGRAAETFEPIRNRLQSGFVRVAGIGLRWQGQNVGSIALWARNENSLNDGSLELLEHIAVQVAGSIGYVRQTLRLNSDFQNQIAISEMVDAISSTESIEAGLEKFAPLLQRFFGAARVSIAIYQPDEFAITDRYRYSPSAGHEHEGDLYEPIPDKIAEGFHDNHPVRVDRAQLEYFAAAFPPFQSRFTPEDRVAITARLKWQNAVVGSFSIFGDIEDAFEGDDMQLLERVATHVSGAIGFLLLNRHLDSDYRNQVAISELADAISTSESVDAGFEKFTRLLYEFYSSARVAVSIFEPNAWVITDMYAHNSVDGHVRSRNLNIPIPPDLVAEVGGHSPSIIDRALLEKFASVFPPYADRLAEDFGVGMTMPLWWQGDAVGSIAIFAGEENALGEYDLVLLARIAAHVSGAIGFLLLNRRLESEISDQVAITDLATALSSTESLEQGLEDFARLLRELFEANSVAISIYAPATTRANDVYFFDLANGFTHESGEFPFMPEELEVELTDLSTNVVDLKMLEKHAQHFRPWADRLAEGIKGSMIMRLWWQGVVVGSLTIFVKGEVKFGERETRLLERIASHVSGAIGNLLLNRGLEAGMGQQAALARIGQIVGSALDIESVFNQALPVVNQLVEFYEFHVTLADIESNTLTVLFDSRQEEAGFESGRIGPLENTLTALVLASTDPVRISVGHDESQWADVPNVNDGYTHGIKSAVGAPLVSDGITFGAVLFRSLSDATYDAVSDELLLQIAAQLSGAIAYHRVNERLSSELREQSTLAELSRVVGSDLDITSTFGQVEEALHRLIPFTSMYVATVDLEARTTANLFHPNIGNIEAAFHAPMPLDRTIMVLAVETQKPTRVSLDEQGNWYGGDPLKLSREKRELSVIAVPLVSEGKVFGVLEFHSDRENAYAAFEDELFEQIGAHLSGAVAYHQVNKQLSQEVREQTVLSRVGRGIGAGLNIDALLDQVLATMKEVIEFDSFFVSSVNPDGVTFTNLYVDEEITTAAHSGRIRPLKNSVTQATISAGRPVRATIDEFKKWEIGYKPNEELVEKNLIEVVAIPLISDGKFFGTIQFRSHSASGHYDEINDEFLIRLAAQLAGAISYDIVNERLEQEANEQATLARISQIVGSELDIKTSFDEVAEILQELIPFHTMFANTVDINAGTKTDAYARTEGSTESVVGRVTPLAGSLSDAVQREGKPVRIELAEDGSWPGGAPLVGSAIRSEKSAVGVPLVSEGAIFGILQFLSTEPNAYRDLTDKFLERVAAHLAGAIAYNQVNERLEKEATEQATLSRISHIVGSELDIQNSLNEVSEILRGIIPFSTMFANTIDIEAGTKTDAYTNTEGPSEAAVGRVTPLANSVVAVVGNNPTPVRIEVAEDGTWQGGARLENSAGRHERSIVCIPLVSEGKVFGSLQFRSPELAAYDGFTDDFLARLGAHLAGAIAYDLVNKRLEKEASEQSTLARISQILGSELEIETAFDQVADLIQKLIPFSGFFATTIDHESGTKSDIYAHKVNYGDTKSTVGIAMPLRGSFTEAVMESRKPLRTKIDEAGNWLGEVPLLNAAGRGEKSIVGVPLISEGRIFGILQFRSRDYQTYDELSDEFLERFASHLAGAITIHQANEKLEKEAVEQATLARIGQLIGSELDIDSVFSQVADVLGGLIEFDVVMVTAPNDDGTLMRNQPVAGSLIELFGDNEWYDARSTLARTTLESIRPTRLNVSSPEQSGASYELGKSTSSGLKSALAVPLISEGSAFAVLQFRSSKEDAYENLSDEFLERIAEQIAGAIAYDLVNARLQTELDEQTVVAQISQILNTSSDVSVVFDDVAEVLKSVIDFDAIVVHSFDTEIGMRVVRYSSGMVVAATSPGATKKIEKSLSETLISERTPIRSVTQQDYADEGSVVIPEMSDGSNSAIAIPLIAQGEVQGALQLRSFEHNAYRGQLHIFLTLIAEQISAAMARAELSESQLILALERERAEGLESQNQQLVQLQRTREQFLGMITHELRTPLTSISAFTDILGHNKEETLTERQFQQLGAVSRNATQLAELIDDLIHMSRMERGQFELTFDRTDLVELVKQVCESMAPVMQHRGQRLEANLDVVKLHLDLDHSRMTQVLNNLISNASKFSPQGSTVTVGMKLLEEGVQIEVGDEGPGIDPDEVEAVFDPFYRIESELVKKVPGTGLGLHVARTIVRQHGGDIAVAPGEHVGTTLQIVLPFVLSDDLQDPTSN